jgi:hypothetical protein
MGVFALSWGTAVSAAFFSVGIFFRSLATFWTGEKKVL